MKQTINDLQNLKGKVVFLRVDFNVPIQNGKVTDVTRINSSLETISALLKEEAKVV
ncbi:MAG: phosphoglycerate kinase, partial [Tenericutes bacterium]